jgi:hypothetical protein
LQRKLFKKEGAIVVSSQIEHQKSVIFDEKYAFLMTFLRTGQLYAPTPDRRSELKESCMVKSHFL